MYCRDETNCPWKIFASVVEKPPAHASPESCSPASPLPAQRAGSGKKAGSGKAGGSGKGAANGKAAAPKIPVLGKLVPVAANGNGKAAAAPTAPAGPAHEEGGSGSGSFDEGAEAAPAVEAAPKKKDKSAAKGLQKMFAMVGVGKK